MPANEQYLRDIKKSHLAFLGSVIAFAFATVLILYRDHDDEWRGFQREFLRLEADNLRRDQAGIITAAGGIKTYQAELDKMTSELEAAQASLIPMQEQVDTAKQAASEAKKDADLKGREVRFARAHRDVARANYDLGVRDALPENELQPLFTKFDDHQKVVLALEAEWEDLTTKAKAAAAKSAQVTAELDRVNDKIKKFNADTVRIEDALREIAPEGGLQGIKRAFMEWPIVDGFNGHLEVKQDWLPELRIRLGMATPARFDRCRTCHLGIDRFGNGNVPTFPPQTVEGGYPQPFSSHPRPDVYLTATSPHPIASFGCTVCHEGQGSATSFHNAQHGANDPQQDHEWNQKYGHFHNHFWEYPMFPARLREAACVKCHHDVVELGINPTYGSTAPKAVEGWNLIRKFGCFGCHEINGFDGKKRIGPDLRLEPTEEEEPKYDSDPNLIRGAERKVGPSLKHVAQKAGVNWIASWTRDPKAFRASTRMPQFFGLTNLQDAHGKELSDVEIAGIASFLTKQSTAVELDKPKPGYKPDAETGKRLFAERGCLACHAHSDESFNGIKSDFGPDLSNVGSKLLPGENGFNWLYTWIREPERHHPRTKMPNLFLIAYQEGDREVDPAADIAQFLIGDGPKQYPAPEFNPDAVKTLAQVNLAGKAMTGPQFEEFWTTHTLPPGISPKQLKGDDVELAVLTSKPDQELWNSTILNYLGRRSVSRYGCYGCHDINGFGNGRPIGTGLADWGRKDTGRLALEHIEEFLHHHGEADGSSTHTRVEKALAKARSNSFESREDQEAGSRAAFFYEDLAHHGRAGFIYQKLRDPRSYDYQKTETKGYVERLVMPKFPFTEGQVEAIATFVLGLVSDPPASNYVYQPKGSKADRNRGEYLMEKFNCVSCHMTSLHQYEFAAKEGDLEPSVPDAKEHASGRQALLALRPAKPAVIGKSAKPELGEFHARIVGIPYATPSPDDDPEDREYAIDLWEPVITTDAANTDSLRRRGEEPGIMLPGSRLLVKEANLIRHTPARGGQFAEWLVNRFSEEKTRGNKYLAWQMVPPPLHLEGQKVQTPWLYRFLREPEQIRFTPALRMPRFNISEQEAATLANYFAAADGVAYPYEQNVFAEPLTLAESRARFLAKHGTRAAEYPQSTNPQLDESWKMLTTTLCIKCHAVGGRPFIAAPNDPNVMRGPNLDRVSQRLRPDWVKVWLFKPSWITPYTSMPLPFPADKKDFIPLFDGDAHDQTVGVHSALMNYQRLIEFHGKTASELKPADVNAGK